MGIFTCDFTMSLGPQMHSGLHRRLICFRFLSRKITDKLIQFTLPDDPAAKPVCYVIYTNKSKLSSFGTEKAYAVVTRLANVPITIGNSV